MSLSGMEIRRRRGNRRSRTESERNEYGEATAIARVMEVLQAQEWASAEGGELDIDFLSDDDDGEFGATQAAEEKSEAEGLDFNPSSLEKPTTDMSKSLMTGEDIDPRSKINWEQLNGDDQEVQVEQLQGLMERIIGIREMGADMPEEQRRRYAKKAIGQLMKDI